MSEVVIRRSARAWSKWNAAKSIVEMTLDRSGLATAAGTAVETPDSVHYTASRPTCEAVATAVAELGLQVEVREGGDC